MSRTSLPPAVALWLGISVIVGAQNRLAQQSAATDIYHVHFNKAAPGQAVALADDLKKPDPASTMPTHMVVLRHQEGDDWDYCVIEHLGTTATVKITAPPPANAPALSAWHSDTFVAGPSWADFSQAMGLAGANTTQTANSLYVVGTFRAVPGHREQLDALLRRNDPSRKVPISHVILAHLEGGPWQFLTIDRYNSWQDFATDHAASAGTAGTGQDGWSENRQHVAYHTDTLADRLAPR